METTLDLNKRNKKCYEVVGNRCFESTQIIEVRSKSLVLKRNEKEEAVEIKNSWVKNLGRVLESYNNDKIEVTGIAKTLKEKGFEYDWKYVMDVEKVMNTSIEGYEGIELAILLEKKRNYESAWIDMKLNSMK